MENDIRKRKLKEGEIVPLSYDFHFVRVFGDKDNIDITEYFISDYYNIPIEEVVGNLHILPRDIKQESRGEKSKQVDLLLELKDKIINIEISNCSYNTGKKERDLVYLARIHGGQLKYQDNDYSKIGYTWQIRLNSLSNADKLRKTYYMISDDGKMNKFSEKFRIDDINLELAGKLDYNDGDEKLLRWCRVIKAKTREDMEKELGDMLMSREGRNKLLREVAKHSRDDDIVELYSMYSREELERNTFMIEATKDITEKVTEKVTNEITEKVTNEVTKKNAIETAKKMLDEKMDMNLISKITGLSKEEIQKLKVE